MTRRPRFAWDYHPTIVAVIWVLGTAGCLAIWTLALRAAWLAWGA